MPTDRQPDRLTPSEALPQARYLTDDCDQDNLELCIFPGRNGDWYVGTATRGKKVPERAVRISTHGTKVLGVAAGIRAAYEAIRGEAAALARPTPVEVTELIGAATGLRNEYACFVAQYHPDGFAEDQVTIRLDRAIAALAAQPQASPPGEESDEDGECELGKLYDAMAQVQYPEPASPPPTQGWEEALAGLEKFHDRLHTRTDGWHCTPQTCEVSRRLATLRSHLSGRESSETNQPQ